MPKVSEQHLGHRRVQQVNEILAVDDTGLGQCQRDLAIVLGERRRRRMTVDDDLELLGQIGQQELDAGIGLVHLGVHRLHDLQAQIAGVGELALDARRLVDKTRTRGSHQGLRMNASSHTGLALSGHYRGEAAGLVKQLFQILSHRGSFCGFRWMHGKQAPRFARPLGARTT